MPSTSSAHPPRRRPRLALSLAAFTALAIGAGVVDAQSPANKSSAKKPAAASKSVSPAKSGPAPEAQAADRKVTLNAEQRALLWKALSNAEQEGCSPGEFAPADLGDRLNTKDPAELARAQEQLVAGVIRYAEAQHGQRFNKGDWPKEWGLKPAAYDGQKDFAFAVHENKLPQWLDSLPPPFARYRALKTALAELRTQTAPAETAPSGEAADGKSGSKSAKASKSSKSAKSKPQKKSAGADGAVTLSRDQQIQTLIANMERWRWMPRDASPDRIEVNSAAGELVAWQGGQPKLAMKAAAGKPGDETPMLRSEIDSLVFNPVWHVPKSIADEELYPKNKRNPGYFKAHDFESSKSSESGLIQKPGPKNALGQIKFDFKNAYSVYLHDTPSQSAFEHSNRNVSHGCVRLEHPEQLAAFVLQGAPEGDPQAIQQLIASAQTKEVRVPKPVPVYLLYFTAFVGQGGKVEFRKDVYDWDTILLQRLAAGRETA